MKEAVGDCVFLIAAGRKIGFGHLTRCRTLADELHRLGAACRFLASGFDNASEIPDVGHPIALLQETDPPEADTIIVDGSVFSIPFLRLCQRRCRSLVLIDDLADRPFPASLVVNHNIYAKRLDYSPYRTGRVLAGLEYALLNRRFFLLRGQAPPSVARALVSLGAGDTALAGLVVAEELHRRLGMEVDVALGALSGLTLPRHAAINVHFCADLPELLRRCSLVVCGLGVTFLEVLAVQRPCVAVMLAENQRLAFQEARRLGYCVEERLRPEAIVDRIAAADEGLKPAVATVLDGLGAQRVAAAISAL